MGIPNSQSTRLLCSLHRHPCLPVIQVIRKDVVGDISSGARSQDGKAVGVKNDLIF